MTYKDNANLVLLGKYKERGYDFALDLCMKIMTSADLRKVDGNANTRNPVIGELCETVLEISILEFMKRNPESTKNWFYTKGLVLKDMDNLEARFLTEIDLVLFTPVKIFLFESKAYNGDKVIVGKGSITREGKKSFNVYSQHMLHTEVFIKTFDDFRMKEVSKQSDAYQLAAFSFAPGTLKDTRQDKWKTFMPFLEVGDVFAMLQTATSGEERWLVKYAKQAVKLIQKEKDFFIAEHLKYVTDLRKSKRN